MFRILTLLICLCCVGEGVAQVHSLQQHRATVNGFLAGNDATAAKTTSVSLPSQRVMAISVRANGVDTLQDSVAFAYLSGRGSAYDYNTMIYPYNYPYSTSPVFAFNGVFTTPQVWTDTVLHWTVNPFTLSFGLYESMYATYNTSRDMTAFHHVYTDSATTPNTSNINRFTTHNIDTSWSFNWLGGVPDSAFKQFFQYNTSGKLAKDSTFEYHAGGWHLASRTLYTYGVAGDLIQIDNFSNTTDTTFTLPLTEQLKYVNTYDASHRLMSIQTSQFDGDTLSPYVNDTFGYTGAASFHTSWKEYQYDPINAYWTPIYDMQKHLNTFSRPDTVNIYGWDSLSNAWVPSMQQVVIYDTANQPDTLYEYDYNFTSFPSTPDFTTTYYYQPYTIPAGLPQVVVSAPTMQVFPDPVQDDLFIFVDDEAAAGKPVAVSISDMAGCQLSRQNILIGRRCQIDVSGLHPGMYVIQAEGLRACRFTKL